MIIVVGPNEKYLHSELCRAVSGLKTAIVLAAEQTERFHVAVDQERWLLPIEDYESSDQPWKHCGKKRFHKLTKCRGGWR